MAITFTLPPDDGVPSPCKNVCALDWKSDLCLGCGRSRAEIAAWTTLSADDKRRVLAAAEARKER
jgi:predicted Fe-S protein YdhL (DUF1289 family)